MDIKNWPIDRLVHYARNPRKNDSVVDRMCSSIREFGFKIPVPARSLVRGGCYTRASCTARRGGSKRAHVLASLIRWR